MSDAQPLLIEIGTEVEASALSRCEVTHRVLAEGEAGMPNGGRSREGQS